MDNALAAGDDWIADDKDAFEASMINFKGEIEKLKTATSTVGSVLEVAANAYIVAYVAIALFAGACLVILLGLLVLLVIPHTSAFARAAIETIGALLVSVSAKIAVLLGAATTVMAGILATTVYAAMQIDSKTKSIPTRGATPDSDRLRPTDQVRREGRVDFRGSRVVPCPEDNVDVNSLEDLDRMLRDSEERLRQLDGVEEIVANTSATHVSDDGLITVEVGADGGLRDLKIDSRAMRLDSVTLAQRIRTACADAHAKVQDEIAATVGAVLGTGDLTSVLEEARAMRSTMDSTVADVSKSINDAIIEVSRLQGRR